MFCLPYFWYVFPCRRSDIYCPAVYSVYCRGSPLQVLWIWRGWNFGARRCLQRFDEFFRAYSNVEVARQTLEKSAHESSSSNDVILVFVLGCFYCCCRPPTLSCLATLTQKKHGFRTGSKFETLFSAEGFSSHLIVMFRGR